MSFAAEVRKELIKHYTKNAHCQKAELAAIILFEGKVKGKSLQLAFEEEDLARKCEAAFKRNFDIHPEVLIPENEKRKKIQLKIAGEGQIEKLGDFYKLFVRGQDPEKVNIKELPYLLSGLTKKPCCQRAFLRGAFIAAGTITDPEKQYHMEIHCDHALLAAFIQMLIKGFDISAKVSKRRNKYLVYLKEGVEIVDMLNVIEAHVSLMNFENARIVREMRGNVNRKVNCETANIEKTINASMKQIEDIEYIRDHLGFAKLDPTLVQIAEARLQYPDVPLSKLGDQINPPIGKSGVNHRFRKLSQIAKALREELEEE